MSGRVTDNARAAALDAWCDVAEVDEWHVKNLNEALLAALEAAAPHMREGEAKTFTTGHCEFNKLPGGCPHHNLRCGYPKCDQRPAAAPPKADAVDLWKPIETAPKDGRMFLCWVDAVRYGERDDGSFDTANCSEVDFCQWQDSEHGGYFMNMMGNIGDGQIISHWQPLPTQPFDSSRSKP